MHIRIANDHSVLPTELSRLGVGLITVGLLICSPVGRVTAGVFQHLDASVPSSIQIDVGTGNVSAWKDQSGNGRDATYLAGVVTYPSSTTFGKGGTGVEFSSVDDNSQMFVLSPEDLQALREGANGFSIFAVIQSRWPRVAGQTEDWNDLMGNSSAVGQAGAMAMRFAPGEMGAVDDTGRLGPTGGAAGKMQTWNNGQHPNGPDPDFGAPINVNWRTDSPSNAAEQIYGDGQQMVLAMSFHRANGDIHLMSTQDGLVWSGHTDIPVDDPMTPGNEGDLSFPGNGNPLWLGTTNPTGGRAFDGKVAEVLILDEGLDAAALSEQAFALYDKWIPEPSTLAMAGLSIVGLLLRRRR